MNQLKLGDSMGMFYVFVKGMGVNNCNSIYHVRVSKESNPCQVGYKKEGQKGF